MLIQKYYCEVYNCVERNKMRWKVHMKMLLLSFMLSVFYLLTAYNEFSFLFVRLFVLPAWFGGKSRNASDCPTLSCLTCAFTVRRETLVGGWRLHGCAPHRCCAQNPTASHDPTPPSGVSAQFVSLEANCLCSMLTDRTCFVNFGKDHKRLKKYFKCKTGQRQPW